jgi:hypothetical protein
VVSAAWKAISRRPCFFLGDAILSPFTPSNVFLKNALSAIQMPLNVSGFIQLYQNNFTPNSDTLLSDFIPANYGGYSPVSLAGKLPTPQKIQTGVYQTISSPFTFSCSGDPSNVIFGAYITVFGYWLAAVPFPTPISMEGGVSFAFALQLQEWALNLLM